MGSYEELYTPLTLPDLYLLLLPFELQDRQTDRQMPCDFLFKSAVYKYTYLLTYLLRQRDREAR